MEGNFIYKHQVQVDLKSGCGLYTIANALINDRLITGERLEESKGGNRLGQLNKWLIEDGMNIFMEPIFCDLTATSIPPKNHVKSQFTLNENEIMPVYYRVRDNNMPHIVAGHMDSEGKLILIDSTKLNLIKIDPQNINYLYDKVYEIGVFFCISKGERVILNKPNSYIDLIEDFDINKYLNKVATKLVSE